MQPRQRLHPLFVSILGLLLVWGGLLGAAGVARGQASYEVLYAFTPGGRNPTRPDAGVLRDSTGTLYGTTNQGGEFGVGTVYQVDASGRLTVLHSFDLFTCSNGDTPSSGVIQDSVGTLYGTANYGGAFGYGTVYKLDATGVLTTLHSFNSSDGTIPTAGVLRDSAGTLYGTTRQGGEFGHGTVYKLDSGGSFTVLHSFTGSDGGDPLASRVIMDGADTLYGTTEVGGAFGNGTVYKLAPSGVLTTLHSFTDSDGVYPAGVIRDSAGTLYGTTYGGGRFGHGTVYKLDSGGSFTVLHSFTGSDGVGPTAGVLRDSTGTLYGTTSEGGAFGRGTVYKLDPSSGLTVLHSFDGSDGASPLAGVIMDGAGNLYGIAISGGPGGGGVLYRLSLAPAALDCTSATASVDFPRLGNRHRYPVTIQGVTAPPGDSVDLTITSIFQDEPVVNPTGKTCPDGIGVGTDVAKVRNERIITAAGDGRVYHIGFTATDSEGASCTGEVQACVPAKEGEACGDQGALFDSTVCPE